MPEFSRDITPRIVSAARAVPAVVLTGPRRAGKTYCLTHVFPRASYHLLEVDFVVPTADGDVELIEAKWSRTVVPAMATAMAALIPRFMPRQARGIVVHRGPPRGSGVTTQLMPGVVARDVES